MMFCSQLSKNQITALRIDFHKGQCRLFDISPVSQTFPSVVTSSFPGNSKNKRQVSNFAIPEYLFEGICMLCNILKYHGRCCPVTTFPPIMSTFFNN